jgi:hypothetical protein
MRKLKVNLSDPTKNSAPKRKTYSTASDKPKYAKDRDAKAKKTSSLPKNYRGGTLRPSKKK